MKIATYNCQGLHSKNKKQFLIEDFINYKIDILCIQETHLQESDIEELKSNKTGNKYHLYKSGNGKKSRNGVGFLVNSNRNIDFQPINDRICQLTTTIANQSHNLIVICAYAPTLENSTKKPELRENFYDQLDSVIQKINSRDVLIVGGDFNAICGKHTSKDFPEYQDTVGKYSKGTINDNGYSLLQFAKNNNMRLSNTMFKHKPAHITTWTCPERTHGCLDSRSGDPRKQPYRNQIDFICTKIREDVRVTDARSYGGTVTKSDHKLVIATMTIKWPTTRKHKSEPQINYSNITNTEIQEKYKSRAQEIFNTKQQPTNPKQRWTRIVESSIEAAKEVLGTNKQQQNINPQQGEISELSTKQKDLKIQIENTTNVQQKQELRKQRNQTMTSIHRLTQKHENDILDSKLKHIENTADDSRRMFMAIQDLQKYNKKKDKLLIETPSGLTANASQQSKIIAEFFKQQFNKDDAPPTRKFQPAKMKIPFTAEEIQLAIKSLKNNRSAGGDKLKAELLKHGPTIYSHEIAAIFNEVAETGVFPLELIQGTIIALQKPKKPKGPLRNLRPITLLSMLRKILANCLLKRTGHKLDSKIPNSQAAYRRGRSTTEHVFATKLLAERAATSSSYVIHLLLLDMSKAFDSINRTILLDELSNILDPDEIHLVSILLNTELQVRIGKEETEYFKTNTGVPQGDGYSAQEFTFYLARALEGQECNNINEHNYCQNPPSIIPTLLNPQIVSSETFQSDECDIAMEYADDMTEITTDSELIEHIKKTLPDVLLGRGLLINEDKTEQYEIKYRGEETWKDCKLLGTKLDTEKDISRRKGLAIAALTSLKHILKSKNTSLALKMRVFKCYVNSVFLYNCEVWTLTKGLCQKIDSFQRRILRTHVLNVRWPKVIKNEDVYRLTKAKPWSTEISERRLKWFGHMIRLPPCSPAQQAYRIAKMSTTRPRGKHQTTWMSVITQQLREHNMTIAEAELKAKDKMKWRDMCENR